MSKKMKVLVSVLVAVLLLGVVGTATVLAQDDEDEAVPQADTLLARVAEILGISEEDLTAAFRQARQEMVEEKWNEALDRWLEKALAEGLITEDEAEEIREWWADKPEALDLGLLRRAFGALAHRFGPEDAMPSGIMPYMGQGMGPRAWHGMGSDNYSGVLDRALENELLTEEEAVRLREWLENRPANAKGVSPQVRLFKAMRGGHGMAPGGGFQSGPPWLND